MDPTMFITYCATLALVVGSAAFALGFASGARSILRRWNGHLNALEALTGDKE